MLATDDDRTLIVDRATLLGPGPIPQPAPSKPERALRAIVAYKLVRSVLSLLLAAVLAVFIASGRTASLQEYAVGVLHHFSTAFASTLGDMITRAIASPRIWLVVCALGFDGVLTGVEGWALLRGRRWGEWLVVLATAALLPFEIAGLFRHPHIGRGVILVANAVVALYLLRRALRQRP